MKRILAGTTCIVALLVNSGSVKAVEQKLILPSYGNPVLSIDGFYTPFFIGRNLSAMSLGNSFTEKFTHEYSYSTGVNIGYFAGRKLVIQTGAWYSPRNYTSELEGTFNNGLGRIVVSYKPTYLTVPLAFKIVTRQRVSPFFKFGMLTDFKMGYSQGANFYGSATFDDMTTMLKTNEQFESMRYSLMVSVGITSGKFTKNGFMVQVEPTFIYSLSNDSQVLSSAYRPFYYGLSISLGYVFVKGEKEADYEIPDYMEEGTEEGY